MDTEAICVFRIKINMNITTNINLPNYSVKYTPTECHDSGTLLYINNKPRKELNVYKSHELESIFSEIVNPIKSNIIFEVVHRHQAMDLNEFHGKYANK